MAKEPNTSEAPPGEGGERTLTFEQALERLKAIVEKIESGEIPLEESIEKYAEGIKLIRQCRTILDRAEQKIQILTKGEGDDLTPDGELPEEE